MANEHNPYEPPKAGTLKGEEAVSPPGASLSRSLALFLSSMAGGGIGAVVFAPLMLGPGDPRGHLVGAALGIVAGLACGFILRSRMRK